MDATAVIIGAGHAGLVMSRQLSGYGVDHVVLERGEVGNSWRTQRWESLRLLTPNWHTRLPGVPHPGDDPDGFLTMNELAAYLDAYTATLSAPVHTGTTVTSVRSVGIGYIVSTDQGAIRCRAVVIASGAANLANVPGLALAVPDGVDMITPLTYRSPQQLSERGVLVVGASATGVQLAEEIGRSGRPVTVAAGEQVRMPRSYRGRDIFWWLETAGVLDERHDEVEDLNRARHLPSPQLIGSPEHRWLDLNALSAAGVRVVGRLCAVRGGVAQFSGGLANTCRLADLKLNRLLARFDDCAQESNDVDVPPARYDPTTVPVSPTLEIDLAREGIGTIVWATGYRPDYSWLDLPVLDRKGRIRHDGGVVRDAAGLYVLGGNLLRTRRSSYIAGAEADTQDLAAHLRAHLKLAASQRCGDGMT